MSTQAGTPLWMAPEMLVGQKYGAPVGFMELVRVRFKADMWSFAVILWEMITQRLPYDSLVEKFERPGDLYTFSIGLSNW